MWFSIFEYHMNIFQHKIYIGNLDLHKLFHQLFGPRIRPSCKMSSIPKQLLFFGIGIPFLRVLYSWNICQSSWRPHCCIHLVHSCKNKLHSIHLTKASHRQPFYCSSSLWPNLGNYRTYRSNLVIWHLLLRF